MLARKLALYGAMLIPVTLSFCQSPEKKSDGSKVPARVAAGKGIYEKRCAICHLAASDDNKVGPGMKGLGTRKKFKDGKAINDQSLRTWIETGGNGMPGFKPILNAEQLRDLLAYLKTL